MKERRRFAMMNLHRPSDGFLRDRRSRRSCPQVQFCCKAVSSRPPIDALRFLRRVGSVSRVEPYLSQPGLRQTDAGIFIEALPPRRGGVIVASSIRLAASSSYGLPASRWIAAVRHRAAAASAAFAARRLFACGGMHLLVFRAERSSAVRTLFIGFEKAPRALGHGIASSLKQW